MIAREGKSPGSPALAPALQQGLALQRAGRHADAQQLYLALVEHYPSQPDLLQLMGLAFKAQGKSVEAEDYFRQSLSLNAAQPHVWNNLGNVLLSGGCFEQAASAYHEAVKLKGHFAQAWDGLGRALLAMNDIDNAEAAFLSAIEVEPSHASAHVGLADIASKRDEDEDAEKLLRQVIASDPNHAVALHNLGTNLTKRGRAREAQPLLEQALNLCPGRADMLTSLGYALQLKGEFDRAIALYREAQACDPLHFPAYVNLSRLLWELDRKQQFIADLDTALMRFPDVAALHMVRGDLLGFASRFAEARDSFSRALKLIPDNPYAHDGVARMCTELGDAPAAVEHHAKAVANGGPTSIMRASYGYSLLQLGEAAAAIKMLYEALEYDPFDQGALSTLTLALRAANDTREHWLADYECFAQPLEVPPPRGYRDMAAFSTDLNRVVNALHDSEIEPAARTLRKGTQTLGRLFGRKIDLVDRLRERIDETILSYVRTLPDDEKHPYLCRKAELFRYRGSWSVRLNDSGFHVDHFHPKGWVSSCYYVRLPEVVADTEGKQGWLKLGHPPFDLRLNDPVRRYIQPREGMLVLFPSYFYHGTVPFYSAQARTTIAFDAVPVT